MEVKPIGIIRSPFTRSEGAPIQPSAAHGARGSVEVYEEYREGLLDIEGFDRIWLLYWFDRAKPFSLLVTPYLDTRPHGVFATRAPSRPNPIGLSTVRLIGVEGRVLTVEDFDILDGTPLLDIKPYVGRFDVFDAPRSGWLDTVPGWNDRADGRFER